MFIVGRLAGARRYAHGLLALAATAERGETLKG
jgi:hypothetical protein